MILEVKEILNRIFIVSRECPFCGMKFKTKELICPKCSDIIKMHNQQEFCRICGKFISTDLNNNLYKPVSSKGTICSQCEKRKPPFSAARGVVLYQGLFKENIYKFKYHGQRSLAPVIARIMVEKIVRSPEFHSFDAIIPIPLTQEKLLRRRYNHTLLLADEISKLLDVPVYQDALLRVTNSSSQSKLKRNERAINIKGAFQVNHGKNNLLNKKILLVDDIVTTGATITECSQLLKSNGAKEILVISLVTGRTFV